MKYFILLAFVPVMLSCSPARSVRTVPSASQPVNDGSMEKSILSYINDYRRSKGLGELMFLDDANRQAYQHSRDMATGRTPFGHDGFDQRISAIKKGMNAPYIPAAAENVAEGQLSAQEVVKGWINSPGHRKNIEGNYNLTGIGVYLDRQGVPYFTQIFIRK